MMNTNIFIKKATIKHQNKYNYYKVNYINSKEKIIIICPEHGEFEQLPSNHLKGQGCKKCANNKQTKSQQQFLIEANLKHNNFYNYSKTEYKGSDKKIIIICPEHGEFEQKAGAHLNGQGCSKCGINKSILKQTKSQQQFLTEANLKNNNFYDYSKTEYKHSEQKVIIICPEHGEFEQLPSEHLKGRGCPECGKIKASGKIKLSNEEFKNRCYLIHNFKYQYFNDYIHSYQKIKINCPEHGEFEQLAYLHLRGHGCPKCGKNISNNEIEIIDFIKELKINNLFISDRKLIKNELDIYLPDFNLAIEYNGLYWHSNKFKDNNYHVQKTNECLNKGIKLIHIFEDEWLFKKEIVKSRIRNLLGKIEKDKRIYARDCYVKEISNNEARKFTERNHLQGFIGAKVHLGLFIKLKNKEYMVSYMSFGSLRKNLGQTNNNQYSYELLRFCSVINYSVIGGANKLLKYFEKKYNPNYLISYADRRWSNGKLYEKLNFTQSHISKPNYFYINPQTPLKRENRFNYRKDILISKYGCKPEYTENYFTTEILGLKRIYDSGNLVFIKEYK